MTPLKSREQSQQADCSGRVLVSVLAFDAGEKVLATLRSLVAQSYPHIDFQLVDNCSSDGTAQRVTAQFPNLEITVLPDNLGYTGGANFVIDYARARGYGFVAICTHDIEVESHAIEHLVKTAQCDSQAGVVGGVEHNLRLRRYRASAGGEYSPWFSRLRWKEAANEEQNIRTFCVHGSLVLFTARGIAEGIRFDADLFMYFDEVDIGFQLEKRNITAWVDRRVVIEHRGSPDVHSAFIGYLMQRNRLYIVKKHGRLYHLLFYLAYSTLLELPAKSLMRIAQGKGRFALACLAGQLDGICHVFDSRSSIRYAACYTPKTGS
jgi:GT2 family glycosyltransferase